MKTDDIRANVKMAKSMDWDELAALIIELEMELQELKPFIRKSDLRQFEEFIRIYEEEKANRVIEMCGGTPAYFSNYAVESAE